MREILANAWIVLLLSVSIDCFRKVKAQRCKESVFFDSGQIAFVDLSGQTDGRTHARTTVRLV